MGYEGNILEKMQEATAYISRYCVLYKKDADLIGLGGGKIASKRSILSQILDDPERREPGGWFDRINCKIGRFNDGPGQRCGVMKFPNMQTMLERIIAADFSPDSTTFEETKRFCEELLCLLDWLSTHIDFKRRELVEPINFLLR